MSNRKPQQSDSINSFMNLLQKSTRNRAKKPHSRTNTGHTARQTNSATETVSSAPVRNRMPPLQPIHIPEVSESRRAWLDRLTNYRAPPNAEDDPGTSCINSTANIESDNLKRVASDRKIELYKYKSRRQELLAQNKPVSNYKPTILRTWTQDDYVKSREKFIAANEKGLTAKTKKTTTTEAPSLMLTDRQIEVKHVNIDVLKQWTLPYHRSDRWMLVVDTRVLLEDMFFVTKLLKSDKLVRLRLPYAVLHDLTAMTSKKQRPYLRIPARRVAQYLDNVMDKHILGQGAIEAEDLLDHPHATDSFVNCCMQQMKLYYYVVLISDDPARRQRACSIGLPCLTLQETKELVRFNNPQIQDVQLIITRDFRSEMQVGPQIPQGYVWIG